MVAQKLQCDNHESHLYRNSLEKLSGILHGFLPYKNPAQMQMTGAFLHNHADNSQASEPGVQVYHQALYALQQSHEETDTVL